MFGALLVPVFSIRAFVKDFLDKGVAFSPSFLIAKSILFSGLLLAPVLVLYVEVVVPNSKLTLLDGILFGLSQWFALSWILVLLFLSRAYDRCKLRNNDPATLQE